MSRRRAAVKRDVLPDSRYSDKVVTKVINSIMLDGKKSIAEGIFYSAMDLIKEKTGQEGYDVFKQALENITFNCFDTNSAISSIGQILMDASKTKSDKAKAIERLVDTYIATDTEDSSSKTQKEQVKEDKKRLKAFVVTPKS